MLEILETQKLKIVFVTLVIRVKSILKNEKLVNIFFKEDDEGGVANDELICIAEMMSPPPELFRIIEEILLPAGLEWHSDFTLLREQLSDVSNFGKPIPGTEKSFWLKSEITARGNYIWSAESIPRNTVDRSFIIEHNTKYYEDGTKINLNAEQRIYIQNVLEHIKSYPHKIKNQGKIRYMVKDVGRYSGEIIPQLERLLKDDYYTVIKHRYYSGPIVNDDFLWAFYEEYVVPGLEWVE